MPVPIGEYDINQGLEITPPDWSFIENEFGTPGQVTAPVDWSNPGGGGGGGGGGSSGFGGPAPTFRANPARNLVTAPSGMPTINFNFGSDRPLFPITAPNYGYPWGNRDDETNWEEYVRRQQEKAKRDLYLGPVADLAAGAIQAGQRPLIPGLGGGRPFSANPARNLITPPVMGPSAPAVATAPTNAGPLNPDGSPVTHESRPVATAPTGMPVAGPPSPGTPLYPGAVTTGANWGRGSYNLQGTPVETYVRNGINQLAGSPEQGAVAMQKLAEAWKDKTGRMPSLYDYYTMLQTTPGAVKSVLGNSDARGTTGEKPPTLPSGGRGGGGGGYGNQPAPGPAVPPAPGPTPPGKITEPLVGGFPTSSNILTFAESDLGALPETMRAYIDALMRKLGYLPTGVYGAYGPKEYMKAGTGSGQTIEEIIASLSADPNAQGWLKWFAFKKGLSGTGAPFPITAPTGA